MNIENLNREQPPRESGELFENNRQAKADRLQQAQVEFGVLQTRLLSSIGTEQDLEESHRLHEEIKKLQREIGL